MSMKLIDIKTLQEVSKETGISVKTLQGRLVLKSFNMIENEDYKKLGERQPTILSPLGVRKIRGDFKKLDLYKLEGKSFLEGCEFLGLKKEDFDINIDNDTRVGLPQGQIVDLDYTYTQIDCFEEEEKFRVTFTLLEDFDEDQEEVYEKSGYWHFNEITA